MSSRWLAGVVVVTGAFAYLWSLATQGWIPHDEGLFGMTAERVARGDLPHVDFHDTYTGGLGALHAVAFALWGAKLSSLRWMLLLAATATVPAVYYLASRFLPTWTAVAVTWTCVIWGPACYFAGLPSWYNLFLAIVGTAALWKAYSDETGRDPDWRWLFVAGLCGGLSILIKIIGVYFVVAGALFIVCAGGGHREPGTDRLALALRLSLVVAAGTFVLVLLRNVRSTMEVVHFIVPPLLMVGVVGFVAWRDRVRSPPLRSLLLALVSFALGAAVPVGIFLVPYLQRGAVDDLVRGVLILPQKRLAAASYSLPDLSTLAFAVPFVVLAVIVLSGKRVGGRWVAGLATALLVMLLLGFLPPIYRATWYSLRPLVPIVAGLACWVVLRSTTNTPDARRAVGGCLLLTLVASFQSLVQYPYPFGVYFCYVAPLLVLAIAAVFSRAPASRLPFVALVFFALFGALWNNTGSPRATGVVHEKGHNTALLLPDRANLRISEIHAAAYTRIVGLVGHWAASDRYIYAGPDSPEVYFLAAKESPFASPYEFLDEEAGSVERILDRLEEKGVNMVVVRRNPEFSRLDPELVPRLLERYPMGEDVGPFVVLWKNQDH